MDRISCRFVLSLHVLAGKKCMQHRKGGGNLSLQAAVRLNKLSALTPAVLVPSSAYILQGCVWCVTELSQVSSPRGTNSLTVERKSGGHVREIGEGKGKEGKWGGSLLEWWLIQVGRRRRDSDGAGATEKRRHHVPCSQSLSLCCFCSAWRAVAYLRRQKNIGIASAHMAAHRNPRNCAEHWTHITAQLDLGHKALNPPVHQLPLCTRLRRDTRAHWKAVTSAHTICPPKAGLWNPSGSYRSLCCQTYMNYPANNTQRKDTKLDTGSILCLIVWSKGLKHFGIN